MAYKVFSVVDLYLFTVAVLTRAYKSCSFNKGIELCTKALLLLFFLKQPQTLQLDFLMKILPNYHHLKKTVKGSSTPARS